MPTLIENRPIKSSLLTHHASRFCNSAFGAGGHSLGIEILKNNRAKSLGKVKTDAVVPILADTGAFSAQSGNSAFGLGVTPTAAPTATKYPLGASLATFDGFKAFGRGKHLTSGQRKRLYNPAINTNRGTDIGWGFVLNGKAKADVPAIRREADGGIVDFTQQSAGISIADPANFRQFDFGPLVIQLAGLELPTLKAECVVQALFSGTGSDRSKRSYHSKLVAIRWP